MQQWIPERVITPERARAAIEAEFGNLSPARVEPCGVGWDNVVYRVNDRWLFRFPQRQIAVAGVEREIDCLPWISDHLDLAPRPYFAGFCDDWPFFGYLPIPGVEACDSREDRSGLVEPLAAFLKELHSPATLAALKDKLPVDPLGRLDASRRVPRMRTLIDKLEPGSQRFEGILESLTTPTEHPCVVHGDLHFRHILVENGLSGIIDWGDLHLNDPAIDLHLGWSFFELEDRELFWSAYGPISEAQSQRARGFGLFVNLALLDYGLEEGLTSVAEEARRSLNRVAADQKAT